jgi:tRNA (adenine57-N1/adenine58-N1)-methyltransferase catalytic subunit
VIRKPRGPLEPGDQVQLTDPKGRQHRLVLTPGKIFHTHRGQLAHDDLIGQPEGCLVVSSGATPYIALRPLLADYSLAMPRGAAVIYPKDAAQIVGLADIFPGATVIEAGAGSGALSCWLLRAVGEEGLVFSYERRPDFAEIARANVEGYFGGPHPAWRLTTGPLPAGPLPAGPLPLASGGEAGQGGGEAGQGAEVPADVDHVVLDMLDPWEYVPVIAAALVPGGLVCCYVATTTQLARTVTALRDHGNFAEPAAWESMQRGWHVEGLAVRPEHRMVGHTGFLITARRLADGVQAPPRRRRPSKGLQAADDLAELGEDGGAGNQ